MATAIIQTETAVTCSATKTIVTTTCACGMITTPAITTTHLFMTTIHIVGNAAQSRAGGTTSERAIVAFEAAETGTDGGCGAIAIATTTVVARGEGVIEETEQDRKLEHEAQMHPGLSFTHRTGR